MGRLVTGPRTDAVVFRAMTFHQEKHRSNPVRVSYLFSILPVISRVQLRIWAVSWSEVPIPFGTLRHWHCMRGWVAPQHLLFDTIVTSIDCTNDTESPSDSWSDGNALKPLCFFFPPDLDFSELSIALFKFIKLQLPTKLVLLYIFGKWKNPAGAPVCASSRVPA